MKKPSSAKIQHHINIYIIMWEKSKLSPDKNVNIGQFCKHLMLFLCPIPAFLNFEVISLSTISLHGNCGLVVVMANKVWLWCR